MSDEEAKVPVNSQLILALFGRVEYFLFRGGTDIPVKG